MVFRSRQDYVTQLRKDLCLYYSYNDYLMEKLMQLFPTEVNLVAHDLFQSVLHKSRSKSNNAIDDSIRCLTVVNVG